MAKWRKSGDYNIDKKPLGQTAKHEVTYWNDRFDRNFDQGYVEGITIYGYGDGSTRILITDPYAKFKDVKGFTKENPINPYFITPKLFKKAEILEAINQINKIDPIDEIKEEILSTLGITKEVHANLLELAKTGNFTEALNKAKEAQENGLDDALWALAESLHEDEPEKAYEAYLQIPQNNPKADVAADRIVHLIFRILDSAKAGYMELTEEEVHKYREDIIRYALRSPELQTFVDLTYHELCGGTGLTPDISNVKGEPETLLAVARLLKNERMKNKKTLNTNFFSNTNDEKNNTSTFKNS